MNLTPKQLNLLRWIEAFHQENQYAPTLDEIAKSFKVSKITALQHLRALEKRGAIRRKRYQTRSIEIIAKPPSVEVKGMPVVGLVQHDNRIGPVPVPENLSIPAHLAELSDAFVLRVDGTSLEPEHVRDGDYLVCAARPPKDGDLVIAALPEGGSAVMRLDDPGNTVAAEGFPANSSAKIPEIKGVVTALFRKYCYEMVYEGRFSRLRI
jgi:repressor LexA